MAFCVARRKGAPLTVEELSRRSGIPEYEVMTMTRLFSWDSVPLGRVKQYLNGCGITGERQELQRIDTHIRRGSYSNLRKSPLWPTFYQPLMEKQARNIRNKLKV